MPRLLRRIQTRGYEMDARQRITPGAIARYFEHARWEAIAEPSFGLQTLFASGLKMVVRAQQLWLGEPIVNNTDIDIEITLARAGNTSVQFAQRLFRASDRAELATGVITAVVIDEHKRPARVPDCVRALVEPVELPAPIALEPRPLEGVVTRPVAVRPSDLDTLLHVNQSRYIDYVDDVRELVARASGYGEQSTRAHGYPRRVAVDYQRETRIGHDLLAYTWVRGPSGVFGFELVDAVDEGLVARATIALDP